MKIRSVAEFMKWVGKVSKPGVLYRGLADSTWEVSASIYGRLQENKIQTVHYNIFREMTKQLLAHVRAEGHDVENHRHLPDLELLAKLQHYGAATCLIDFTSSPLVALWFACQTPMGQSGKVVAFDSGDPDLCSGILVQDLDKPIDEWLPINTPNERLWVFPPKKANNRIIVQNSIFIFGKPVIAQETLIGQGNCVVEDKGAVLKELAMLGITAGSLFCDFAGFVQQNARNAEYRNWVTDNDFISGLIYQESGDNESAIEFYDKAIKANPQDASSYNNRGNAKRHLGDHKGAIADYDRTIEIDPQDADAYNNRGIVKRKLGDSKGAIADYGRAIEINPQFVVAYNNRGIAKGLSGDHEGAIIDFDKAIDINPQYAAAYHDRGTAKSALGDYEDAIANYDQAININPHYANAYYNRGNAKSALGDYEDAIADYNRAIETNPQYAPAYHNRAIAKEKSGDKEGAEADFQKAKEIDPSLKPPQKK